ncbi:hypothetical protein [Stenotrophomonas maltophilia]|uniref:Uncharacterized protein n=1 Tax=Stenotrophomonas maltophilia TaxID=40324 RepID=A0A2W6I2H0_STEMA|nr:hypothetical protein [Stenotrophomonas maltophilia]PZS88156.1 hypothetical protein A7X83_15670 [Stenotrophomonas maltophilia]
MYDKAIAHLLIAVETADHNAPIWERENNLDQASLCRETAKSCRAAIELLQASPNPGEAA